MKNNLKRFEQVLVKQINSNDGSLTLAKFASLVSYELHLMEKELEQLKQKGIDFIDKGTSESFLEENICWYRGKICIPIDEVLGKTK